MFDISKHKILETDLPIIADNYQVLLADENPILYIGTNNYNNIVLGVIIEDDDESRTLYYYHLILDNRSYFDFINQSKSLLELIKEKNIAFIISKDYSGNIISADLISYSEIPGDYLPLENSYCPDIAVPPSLNYGISLQGKKADLHRGEVSEINNIQSAFSDVLRTTLDSLGDFDLEHKSYLEPALAGSFRINFNIQFENLQTSIFQIDQSAVATYLTRYLDYIITKLPSEDKNIFRENSITSQNFKEVEKEFVKIYDQAQIKIAPIVIEQKLIESINSTALKFETVSEQIKTSHSFNQIEFISLPSGGLEYKIGIIDKGYYETIQEKLLIPEVEKETDIIEEDIVPKQYRILVYHLNVESGKGGAMIFYGEEENYDRISLHIQKNGKELSNTPYTNSLHEGKVVSVKGIARKVNNRFKVLTVIL